MVNKVFSLEVLPAKEGDCLLLRYGPKSKTKQKLALVDGGPGGVFDDHLVPRLEELRTELGVPAEDAMALSWIMVSHVDSDHTTGVVQLTEKLLEPGPNVFVAPERLWHNSFDRIIGNDATELLANADPQLASTSAGRISVDAEVDAQTSIDAMAVLAGIDDSYKLRDNAKKLRIPVNRDGEGGLLTAEEGGKAFSVGDGLSFTVIGPMLNEVKRLQKKHDDWLKAQKKKKQEAAEALAAYVDPSVSNQSSIVVLAEFADKTILFTGDARGDLILKGIKLVGLGDTLHVDVLKGQHHGSENNYDLDFFVNVTADHYVFSGDGKHGNPERETLDLLRRARPDADYQIYLTYKIDDIDVLREEDWEEKRTDKEEKGKDPGPVWSASRQSLAAFFKKHPDMKDRVVPWQDGLFRHRIDLLARPD